MADDPKTLCEVPEVFRLVNMLTVLIDHAGKRLPGILISPKDDKVQTFRDAVVEVLEGVGYAAEWSEKDKKGRTFLGVKFPSQESEDRFREACKQETV